MSRDSKVGEKMTERLSALARAECRIELAQEHSIGPGAAATAAPYRNQRDDCVPQPHAESWTIGTMRLTRFAAPRGEAESPPLPGSTEPCGPIVVTARRVGDRKVATGAASGQSTEIAVEWMADCDRDRDDAAERVDLRLAPIDDPELFAALTRAGTGPRHGGAPALLGDFLFALAGRLPNLPQSEVPAIALLTRAMVGHCLLGEADRLGDPPSAAETEQRLKVVRVIRDNIGSARLDVSRLCQLTGLSRSTMYRLFDRDGGVATVIRRIRLRAAHALLSDRARVREPISSVAETCGYHCVASFNRAFRAEFACTPGEVRALSAADPDPAAPTRGKPREHLALHDLPR